MSALAEKGGGSFRGLKLLLSASAGALVYVGATQLAPRAEQEHRRHSLVALGVGIVVALVIVLSKA